MHESIWVGGRYLLGRDWNGGLLAMATIHQLSTSHLATDTEEAVSIKSVPLNTHSSAHTHTHTHRFTPPEAVLRERDFLILFNFQPVLTEAFMC